MMCFAKEFLLFATVHLAIFPEIKALANSEEFFHPKLLTTSPSSVQEIVGDRKWESQEEAAPRGLFATTQQYDENYSSSGPSLHSRICQILNRQKNKHSQTTPSYQGSNQFGFPLPDARPYMSQFPQPIPGVRNPERYYMSGFQRPFGASPEIRGPSPGFRGLKQFT